MGKGWCYYTTLPPPREAVRPLAVSVRRSLPGGNDKSALTLAEVLGDASREWRQGSAIQTKTYRGDWGLCVTPFLFSAELQPPLQLGAALGTVVGHVPKWDFSPGDRPSKSFTGHNGPSDSLHISFQL